MKSAFAGCPKLKCAACLSALAGIAALLPGCCSSNPSSNTTTCSVTFSNAPQPVPSCTPTQGNVSGYVVFTGAVSIVPNSQVVVQWSTDSFASTVYTGAGVPNVQNAVAVPFGFSVQLCGPMTIQVRAFQDPGYTGSWASGEAAGRYDGTDSGNGSFTDVTLAPSDASAGGIVIFLDGTGSQ